MEMKIKNKIDRKEDTNAEETWYGLCNVFYVHITIFFSIVID